MAWRITDALIQRHDVQVIVWPEALVRSAEIPLRTWLTQHDELLKGRSLVLGGIISMGEGEGSRSKQAHNSLLAYGPNSHGRYDKRELVPMTEQWPDSGPWPWLAAWADAQPWLQRGAEVQTPLSVAGHAVGASICYEDAFAHIYQGLPPTVGWLINASNDGWFAHTPVMPAQHLALSRLRALEQQKPLVRAANIGPSAMISANGHLLTQTTLGRPQLLYADLQPHQGHTPYARWGHGWLLIAVLLMLGLWLRVFIAKAQHSPP
jgi:apolipoprotein N-acyltransferase